GLLPRDAVGVALAGEAVLDVLRLSGVDRVPRLRGVAGLAAARVASGVVHVGIAHAPKPAGRGHEVGRALRRPRIPLARAQYGQSANSRLSVSTSPTNASADAMQSSPPSV